MMRRVLLLQGSVGSRLQKCHRRWTWNNTSMYNNELHCTDGRRTTCLVGKSRERHDKSSVENLDSTEQCFCIRTSPEGQLPGLAIAYVDDVLMVVDEEGTDGLSAVAGVRDLHAWRPWKHRTFTQCAVQIVQSCRQGETLVLLDLPSVRRKHRDESTTAGELSALRSLLRQVDVARHSSDSSVASTLVVASGSRWSCHSFHNAGSKQTCLPCVVLGSDPHCELIFIAVFVLLDGLMQVGLVAVQAHHKVGNGLESRTHLSWSKRDAKLVWSAGTVTGWPELQAAANAARELTHIRFSLWESLWRYSTTDEMAGSCGASARTTGT